MEMLTTNTSWTTTEAMELFSNETLPRNWTSVDGFELTTVDMSPENWTDFNDFANDTSLNISSIYLLNASKNSLSTIEQKSSPGLTYTLLGLNALFLAFGLFGNTTGVVVMLRSAKELKTHTLLVVVLAITDIGVLATNSFHVLPSPLVFNFDARAMADIGCTVFLAVDLMVRTNAAYVTVLICIDRFIAVQFPLQYKRIVSRKARVISLCVCAGVAIFVGMVAANQFSEVENGSCLLDTSAHKSFGHIILRFVLIALVTLIPFVILLSLTPVIIFKINQRQAIKSRMASKEEAARLIRTTVMLICIVLAYIILICVPAAVFVVLRFGGVDGNASNQIMLLFSVTAVQINHSINITFYISNMKFREELLRLFGCCCSASQSGVGNDHGTPVDEKPNV